MVEATSVEGKEGSGEMIKSDGGEQVEQVTPATACHSR